MTRTPINGKLPWDTSCLATAAGLERMMRALVVVDGHFSDCFSAHREHLAKPSRSAEVHFRVWIPEGWEQKFCDIAQAKLIEPPRAQVGMGGPPSEEQETR